MKKKHLIIPAVILLFSCVNLFWVFDFLLNRKDNSIRSILEIESSRSTGAIVDRFNQTYAIIDNMNYQIRENPRDKKYINNILTKYKTNPSLVDALSWTVFSWADTANKIVVDTIYGIMKTPFDLSIRDYIPLTMKKPDVLYLGKPVIGSTSKKWMIPGGVGLNDKNGNYVGSMTIGFEIDALARIIQKSLQNNNIKITLVYDQGGLPIFQVNSKNYNSFRDQSNIDDKGIKKILTELKSSNNSQIINIKLVKDQRAYLARKLENYPFVLVLEYDEIAIINELWSSIVSRIYEILLIIFAASALLYLIYKREQQTRIERFLKTQLHSSNLCLQTLIKSVNHDLRNYISGILGLANIIAGDEESNKETPKQIIKKHKEYAVMIANQAEIMLKFSKSLMRDEDIDNQSQELGRKTQKEDFEDIDVSLLINELIFLKKPFIKEHKISVKTEISEELPILRTNLIELRKILDNLIINAIKYSPNGAEIIIKIWELKNEDETHYLRIDIVDNGIGMTFEEITQALAGNGKLIDKSGLDKEIESYGIGLPIVQKAVENLGARMEIESKKSAGTTVKLWFNIDREASQKKKEKKKIIKNNNINLPTNLADKSILVVDDNDLNSLIVINVLNRENCRTYRATNGVEALEVLDKNPHMDLILMDGQMDVMDGYEATKIIRNPSSSKFKNFTNNNIPIIAVMGNEDRETLKKVKECGMNEYASKGSSSQKLIRLISKFLQ